PALAWVFRPEISLRRTTCPPSSVRVPSSQGSRLLRDNIVDCPRQASLQHGFNRLMQPLLLLWRPGDDRFRPNLHCKAGKGAVYVTPNIPTIAQGLGADIGNGFAAAAIDQERMIQYIACQ